VPVRLVGYCNVSAGMLQWPVCRTVDNPDENIWLLSNMETKQS
jgi:hypothetical protein